jgi:hypothetical protein
MSSHHVIITRFNYRFKKDAQVDKLLSPENLEHRINIFKTFCYPSVVRQTCPKFYWILIIDPLLPQKYFAELTDLITLHEQSNHYNTKGPRKIWLHTWDWDSNKLDRTDWVMKYLANESQTGSTEPDFLITSRLDSDDSLTKKFIMTVQEQFKNDRNNITDFKYISYANGYQYYVAKNTLKLTKNPMIALGLTLITKLEKWPMTVYLGSHTQIPKYLKRPELHDRMLTLYKRNNQYPTNMKDAKARLAVYAQTEPMWIRTIHGFNLQKNLRKQSYKQINPQITRKIKDILYGRFSLDYNPDTPIKDPPTTFSKPVLDKVIKETKETKETKDIKDIKGT